MIIDIPFESWDGWTDSRYAPNHFYQTYEWFSVLASTWTDLTIKIRMIAGRMALPVFSKKIGPLVLEGAPLRGYFTPYGGFLGKPQPEFKRTYLSGDFNEITFPPHAGCQGGSWLAKKTIIVDLRNGFDAIWESMKKDKRKKIRKAIKANVRVEECPGTGWVNRAYEIFKMTYDRQHISPPANIRFFHQIAEKLLPKHARVFTAIFENTIIGYAIVGFDARTSYAIDGSTDRMYRHVSPDNILHWEVLHRSVADHLESYDLCGANIETIANFKNGFGGDVVNFMSKEYSTTLLGAIAWKGYTLLRPAIKRVEAINLRL